ncbi:disease resistance protein At4g27190-like [Fagus crenata]
MELAAAALGAVLAPICNFLCGCVTSKITTTLNLRSKLDDMVKDMKSLLDRREVVKDEKEAAEREGNVIRAQVVKWLGDVEKLQPSVEQMVILRIQLSRVPGCPRTRLYLNPHQARYLPQLVNPISNQQVISLPYHYP